MREAWKITEVLSTGYKNITEFHNFQIGHNFFKKYYHYYLWMWGPHSSVVADLSGILSSTYFTSVWKLSCSCTEDHMEDLPHRNPTLLTVLNFLFTLLINLLYYIESSINFRQMQTSKGTKSSILRNTTKKLFFSSQHR